MIRIPIVLLSLGLTACLGVPGSRLYTPANDAEKQLFSQAHRDIFPSDVRANPKEYSSTVIFWSSIVRKVDTTQNDGIAILFEHHYWDFIEDYSVQKAIAFLSPRGEGNFTSTFPAGTTVKVGDMALVYGVIDHVEPNGTIVLSVRSMRRLREDLYATDVFDYGRGYLVKKDKDDFKLLRVPR